jgi:hypothetical protein
MNFVCNILAGSPTVELGMAHEKLGERRSLDNNSKEPRLLSVPFDSLKSKCCQLRSDDPALQALVSEAKRYLKQAPFSVMDKSRLADTGDKHDYLSLAPYFWPDPSKPPDGTPYVRRDGKINPDSKVGTDSVVFAKTCDRVFVLGLAYYITRDARFAERAAHLAKVWFLEPGSKMNPHMNFAQAVPGLNTGRGYGILEARKITLLLDGLVLVKGCESVWADEDDAGLNNWLSEFYAWLTTSRLGMDEMKAKNNHGTWYDVLRAHIAIYLRRYEEAERVLEAAKESRVGCQILADGSLPNEMSRTKSLDYVLFNLEALVRLALLADAVGVDIWGYRSRSTGGSLLAAVDMVAPYADASLPWPKEDIGNVDRERILPILAAARTMLQSRRELDRPAGRGLSASREELYRTLMVPAITEKSCSAHWNLWTDVCTG